MSEMIRPSFEKMAFIGEKARDARFVSRVDATKDKLNVALNPIDPVAERRMNGNASAVVKGLAESGEWSCESVRSLVETVNDPTRSANRDIAKERLDVLATSTYIVMTHGENEALHQAIGTKDGAVIDAALPESLKGIGGRVAEIATEQEITDPKLKEALKKLDRRADVLRASGSVGEEKLKELIGDKILELSELVDELDDRGYEELTRVSAYLGAEAEKLGVEDVVRKTVVKDDNGGHEKGHDDDDGLFLRGEIENMPADPEKQMALARKLLDIVEFRQLDPWSIDGAPYRSYLDNIREHEGVAKVVKQEIETRLRLQKIMGVMTAAGGWLGERTPASISAMLTRAEGESGLFTVDDMKFLLQGKEGLSVSVAAAWNEFQRINIGRGVDVDGRRVDYGSYHDILLEIYRPENAKFRREVGLRDDDRATFLQGGTVKIFEDYVDKEGMWSDAYDNYFMDANLKRKEVVRAFIAEKIKRSFKVEKDGKKRAVNDYEATKGVQLAWNLMVASGETSIFNAAFVGHNDLTELMLTKFDTLDRMYKGKPIGAFTCMQDIVSLCPTWLRYMSDRTIFGVLKAEDIDLDKMNEITKYSIDYWYSSMVTQKIAELKAVMRSEEASPKELMNPTMLKKVGEWVGKAAKFPSIILDHHGKPIINSSEDTLDSLGRPLKITGKAKANRERRIRFLLVAGWAEQAVSNIDLGWDESSWRGFRDMLTREYSFDENHPENKRSFVTKEEMDYIDKVIMGRILGGYPSLKKLQQIRESRKDGTWNPLKSKPKSFDV